MTRTIARFLLPLLVVLIALAYAFMPYAAQAIGRRTVLFLYLLSVCSAAALVTLIVTHFTMRNWIRSLRLMIRTQNTGKLEVRLVPPELKTVAIDLNRMVRDLNHNERVIGNIRVMWTADTLRQLLHAELPKTEIIVVSNREPYIHNEVNGAAVLQKPTSGLVSAIEPVMRACKGTWIAQGTGSADKLTVDKHDHIAVPPEDPSYILRRIWLTEAEEEGYYHGFANEGLWPLCHLVFTRPIFREEDWAYYETVNRKFADAVVAEAKTDAPLILVQDYHFALLPQMIREKLPKAIIVTFWHIPWPNAEAFSICPWREEILKGLLGSSILGFHTQLHCSNFYDTLDRFLECRIDRERSTASFNGQQSLVRPYPISIAWPPQAAMHLPLAQECRRNVFEKLQLPATLRLGVGIERLDYTKGIIDRFHALTRFFRQHPGWIGKFTFVQVASPSRSKLPDYQAVQEDTVKLAADINAQFGRADWHPIILIMENFEQERVFELFRAADLCIVSSLHDGMNLVAKEFVAAREDGRGVLILSTFAGASEELTDALIVNPHDAKGMAETILRALQMPGEEQEQRMNLLRGVVRENNVYRWAGQMLMDAARLQKSQAISDLVEAAEEKERKPALAFGPMLGEIWKLIRPDRNESKIAGRNQ